jgi:hypothetical protein
MGESNLGNENQRFATSFLIKRPRLPIVSKMRDDIQGRIVSLAFPPHIHKKNKAILINWTQTFAIMMNLGTCDGVLALDLLKSKPLASCR